MDDVAQVNARGRCVHLFVSFTEKSIIPLISLVTVASVSFCTSLLI